MFGTLKKRLEPYLLADGKESGEIETGLAELSGEYEEGENIQELTDPEEEEYEDFEEEIEEEDFEEEESDDEDERDYERDAAYQQMRLDAQAREERIAELENELAGAQAGTNSLFETTYKGRLNPYTGEVIETMEDYNEYQQEHIRQTLASAGLPENFIDEQINNHPAIKKANAVMQQIERANFESQIANDLVEIRKINPEIRDIQDLAEDPDADIIEAYVRNGHTYAEAYSRVHHMRNPQKKTVKRDTKSHIKTTSGGAGDYVEVPAEVMAQYRAINPKATDKEIREHYKKSRKE